MLLTYEKFVNKWDRVEDYLDGCCVTLAIAWAYRIKHTTVIRALEEHCGYDVGDGIYPEDYCSFLRERGWRRIRNPKQMPRNCLAEVPCIAHISCIKNGNLHDTAWLRKGKREVTELYVPPEKLRWRPPSRKSNRPRGCPGRRRAVS